MQGMDGRRLEALARKRVAAYARVSTELDRQEDSLRMQQEWFAFMYGAIPDMQFVGIYTDERSGTSIARRPGFQRMLADCRAGKIDAIVCKSLSRFARNMGDFLTVIRELHELGIAVYFEKENLNTLMEQGEMFMSVLAAASQEEVNAISQSLTWAIRRRDSSGNPDYRVSYGYRKDAKTKSWYVYEPEAERVRMAFQLAAAGKCYAELEAILHELEARAPTGAHWKQRRLHYVLTNVHYIGDVLTQKTYVPDYLEHRRVRNIGAVDQYYLQDHHPAIVDRELFKIVNARIDRGLLRSNRRGGQASTL